MPLRVIRRFVIAVSPSRRAKSMRFSIYFATRISHYRIYGCSELLLFSDDLVALFHTHLCVLRKMPSSIFQRFVLSFVT